MKQSQIGHIFVYILAIIVVAFLLLFGYNAVSTFREKANQVSFVKFQSEFQKEVRQIAFDYESLKEKSFTLPDNINEVCMIPNHEGMPALSGTDYPLIEDSVNNKAAKNIFLLKDGNVMYSFDSEPIITPEHLYCLAIRGASLTVEMLGKGTHAVISPELQQFEIAKVEAPIAEEQPEISNNDPIEIVEIEEKKEKKNSPPSLNIPNQEINAETNVKRLLISKLSDYASDKETSKKRLHFELRKQEKPDVVFCNIQDREQFTCTVKQNKKDSSKVTIGVSDGTNFVMNTFTVSLRKVEQQSTCGNGVCDPSEDCDTCSADCTRGCNTPSGSSDGRYLKCGYDPITRCQEEVSCGTERERFGLVILCQEEPYQKFSYKCYNVSFINDCAGTPTCKKGGVVMKNNSCT